jgi:hypothetical protein
MDCLAAIPANPSIIYPVLFSASPQLTNPLGSAAANGLSRVQFGAKYLKPAGSLIQSWAVSGISFSGIMSNWWVVFCMRRILPETLPTVIDPGEISIGVGAVINSLTFVVTPSIVSSVKYL